MSATPLSSPERHPSPEKYVFLSEWWLAKPCLPLQGLAVGGIAYDQREKNFLSTVIAKRHEANVLETEDRVVLHFCSFINSSRSSENGFPHEVCEDFLLGFPDDWQKYNAHSFGAICVDGDTAEFNRSAERQEFISPNDGTLKAKRNNCNEPENSIGNVLKQSVSKHNNCNEPENSIGNVLKQSVSKHSVECSNSKKAVEGERKDNTVVIEKSIAEDLPPGWIKEVTIKKKPNGIRKDPVYKDPVSGHAFRSKRDVQRYLASGYIRPPRRRIQDGDKLTPSPAGKRHKLNESAPEQQLSAGRATFDKSSLELIDDNSSRKGQDVNIQSGTTMVAPIPTGESVVKMHSLEDRAEDLSEMEKISDPVSAPVSQVGNPNNDQSLTAVFDQNPCKVHSRKSVVGSPVSTTKIRATESSGERKEEHVSHLRNNSRKSLTSLKETSTCPVRRSPRLSKATK